MSHHMQADHGKIGLARPCVMDELVVEHHDHTIRQFQPFVEILTDQQNRLAAIAGTCNGARLGSLFVTAILDEGGRPVL